MPVTVSSTVTKKIHIALEWRHNECDGASNHRCLDCLLIRLFRRRSNKASKLRVIGLCEGNPTATGGVPSQRASNVENVPIWRRHHVRRKCHIEVGSYGESRFSQIRDKTKFASICRNGLVSIEVFTCVRLNTLRWRQNGWHFADDIFNCSLNEKVWISITISLEFVLKGRMNT